MKILMVHNHYQKPGGEDVVFASETALLETHGHQVVRYTDSNDRIDGLHRMDLVRKTVWNRTAERAVRALIQREAPDVMHVHNTLPLISPSVYEAARAEAVPVVHTLHNFRLLCPNALLYRDAAVCEECLGRRVPWPAVVHGCYRDSRAASAVVGATLTTHRLLGTWRDRIDRYIALSEFAKTKFIEGGLPPEKIAVKPNFLDVDPGMAHQPDGDALFVGRLSPEKGLRTLLAAVERYPIRVKIAGQASLRDIRGGVSETVEWLGHQSAPRVRELMRKASLLIMPSEWYEGCPLTLLEAFAVGLPVIASRLGVMAEIVTDHRTGLHFTAGDADDLAAKIRWAREHPDEMAEMGRRGRAEFEAKYTRERNYRLLMDIYREAAA